MPAAIRIVFTSHQLTRVADEFVLPLRPDLYLDAVRKFGASRVVDAADVLSDRDLRRYWARSLRETAAFIGIAENHPNPIYASTGTFLMEMSLHMFAYAVALLSALQRTYGKIYVSYDGTEPGPWIPNNLQLVMTSWYCAAIHCRENGMPVELERIIKTRTVEGVVTLSGRINRAVRIGIGNVINALGPLRCFVDAGPRQTWASLSSSADIAVGGIQLTDVAFQSHLVEALGRRPGVSTVWIKGSPSHQLERAEVSHLNREVNAREVEFDGVPNVRWRHWFFVACSGLAVRSALVRMWQQASSSVRWSRGALEYLIETTAVVDPATAWFRMDKLMSRLKPRVLLGNSTFFDMGTLAAWARRQRVPFVMLPHGFPNDPAHLHHTGSATVFIMFGKIWPGLLRRTKLGAKAAAVCDGGRMFLPPRHTVSAADMAGRPLRVLFLENCDMANPIFLYSARQYVEWLMSVGRAAHDAGLELVIRGHPRKLTGSFYTDIASALRREGASCTVDHGNDLNETVRSARLVVTRLLDTAAVRAVLLGTPLAGFFPVRSWPPRERWFRAVAPLVNREKDLVELLRNVPDPDWCAAESARQQVCLKGIVDFDNDSGFDRVAAVAAAWAKDTSRAWDDLWNQTV